MKRIAAVWLTLLLALTMTGCSDPLKGVELVEVDSQLYSQSEIRSAMETAAAYFKSSFRGCTLLELQYAGDERAAEYAELAQQYEAQDAIVLLSSFLVDDSGVDGSLEPNQTYTGWKWILVRNSDGRWRHVDHGYG